ncbi:hypothetical protein NDK47_23970 [Brevibacillus ruminantium]|uniref:Phage protein n=1 Tax=Brevibacillus ruminantium TaxID=2950604 RepID=A0ABY4WD94_9BACL|nr:hypothetical protein [Brevibacillus ruminantium]USG65143.1 hypothetical protein NDK47_23970 [Brevibacillus ruminantium]
MKNVMTRAWEIAKLAANKFGGKVKEFFAQSLRLAWYEVKSMTAATEKVIVEANHDTKLINVYGERNGKVFFKRENLNVSDYREAYGYLVVGKGISTAVFYTIVNDAKQLNGVKVH